MTKELLYAYAGLTGSIDDRIRADMTFFTAPNDGAVFSIAQLPLVTLSAVGVVVRLH